MKIVIVQIVMYMKPNMFIISYYMKIYCCFIMCLMYFFYLF
jgi:hypothetical protein